jgi:hypothetical protein
MPLLACPACGANFSRAARSRQRYCDGCRRERYLGSRSRERAHAQVRGCAGCGAALVIHLRERNPRKWCSEACRVRAHRLGLVDQAEQAPAYLAAIRLDPCVYCGRPAETLDHVEPRTCGGSNDWSNLAAACHHCNAQKGSRDLLRYLLARPLLAKAAKVRAELSLLRAA